ncbi:MAG TPA: hypothetical protein VIM70_08545 [Clostridium sp.]|uniref:hypothetical protein n=1 Tax=Clostridium sp. TaxID=1506 RepID=UPI002F95EBAC
MKRRIIIVVICGLILTGCTNSTIVRKNVTKSTINTESTLKSVNEKLKAYILAFDSVWQMDSGLNSDIKYISINTKGFKDFSEGYKKQLFNYVADKYHVTMLDMNIDELKEKGYLNDLYFKEGIVFQISKYNSNSSNSISFEGSKWRSGTGAIGFSFEAQKKNEKWELKKCNMTWIS